MEYTTIRKNNHGYKVGDIIYEMYPNGVHRAEIIDIEQETLNNLSIDFLRKDTDLETRTDVYKLFGSFYGSPLDFRKDKFYIFYLRKMASN